MLRPRATPHSSDIALRHGSSRQVRERGKKVLANIIAQQEGLITRPHFKAFVRKLGTQAVPNTRPERPAPRHRAARPVGQGWPHLRPHLDATPVGQGWPHLDAACNTTPCPFSRGWILALSAQRHSCLSRPCPRRRRGGLRRESRRALHCTGARPAPCARAVENRQVLTACHQGMGRAGFGTSGKAMCARACVS